MSTARILLVEDESIIAMELAGKLTMLGYEITSTVNSGDKALQKIKEDPPDLILMDIRIKGKEDGIDVAKQVRDEFGIPVIFTTAYLDEERIERAKITMPFGYVLKPFQDRDLKVTIEMALYVSEIDKARKKAEKKVTESEEKYRIAFETNSDSVTITRMDGIYVDVNPGFTETTGYTREEVIGKSAFDIEIWVDPQDRVALVSALNQSGQAKNLRATFRHKNGSHVIALLSASVIKLNAEPHILLFSTDITQSVQAEESLLLRKQKFRQIFDNIPIPYFEVSLDGIILEISPSVENYLKYSRMDLVGRTIRELYANPEDQVDYRAKLTKNGEIVNETVKLKDKDGSIVEALLFSKLNTEKGVIFCSLVVKEPSSGEVSAQLQQIQRPETISILAGGFTHSFNNILSSILGNAEFALRHELKDDDPGAYSVQQIIKAAHRARSLTKQILTLSRWKKPDPSLINLNPIIKETSKFLKATINANISIRTSLKASLDTVIADPISVHQMLMYLCTRAIDTIHADDGLLEIRLSDTEPGRESNAKNSTDFSSDSIELSVTGSDPEMSENPKDQVLSPLSVDNVADDPDWLIHPAVCDIVRGLKGGFRGNRKSNILSVVFPVIREESAEDDVLDQPLAGGRERILFVDDDEQIVEFLERFLESMGYTITGLSSSKKAYETFAQTPADFDLLISDMNMDGLTGDRLAEKVLAIRPDLPVIICTGYDEMLTKARLDKIGINAVMMKPFMMDEMDALIRRVMQDKTDRSH